MAQFPTTDISILLDASAYKAGVNDFDIGGFSRFADFLKGCPSDFGVTISERYLKEQLYDKIEKARNNGDGSIGLSQAYVDTLSQALGFNSFKAFNRFLDKQKDNLKKGKTDFPELKYIVGDDSELKRLADLKNVLDSFNPPIKLLANSILPEFEQELLNQDLVFFGKGVSKKFVNFEKTKVIYFTLEEGNNIKKSTKPSDSYLDYNGILIAISILKEEFKRKQRVLENKIKTDGDQFFSPTEEVEISKSFASKFTLWIGRMAFLVLFTMLLILPCPNHKQQIFFRAILALVVALLAFNLPKFLGFKLKGKSLSKMRIIGVSVFLLIYYVDPQKIIKRNDCNPAQVLFGKVIFQGKPLPQALIDVLELDKKDITSFNGSFDLSFSEEPQFPLSISIHFKKIDTVISLAKWPENSQLLIYLKDTIPELTENAIQNFISSYLNEFSQKHLAEHFSEMAKNPGGDTSISKLIAAYSSFDKLGLRGYRNQVQFTNGFESLNTQKSLKAGGIKIYPMNPYQYYGMIDFYSVIYEDKFWGNKDQLSKRMRFALINSNWPKFSLREINRNSDDNYMVSVDFTEGLLLVKTEVECSETTKRKKYQKTSYVGMRPFEKFIFQFQNGRWFLTGTSKRH